MSTVSIQRVFQLPANTPEQVSDIKKRIYEFISAEDREYFENQYRLSKTSVRQEDGTWLLTITFDSQEEKDAYATDERILRIISETRANYAEAGVIELG
jgi:hypothetical protein